MEDHQSKTHFLPGPLRRLRGLLLDTRRVASDSAAQLRELTSRIDALSSRQRADHDQLVEILHFVHDRPNWRRQQLYTLRSDHQYQRPFDEPEPLVSVVIPTYSNYDLLCERAIPSVLAQTYQNFEVVVVGDAAPEEARKAVEGFADPRVTFFNLPYRGPYPDRPEKAWLVSGGTPCNEAVRRARGLWIAPLADDDAFRPDHLERLLEFARSGQLELAYGRLAVHFADGSETTIGCFPPELGHFGMQAALYHSGLGRVFEYELADAAFGLPNDWAFCLRTMEAGVRIGMLDEVIVDYYPSKSWAPRWTEDDGDDRSVTDQSARSPGTT